jgi:predicted ATP-grasp superfamily ATP-dependent carboligase
MDMLIPVSDTALGMICDHHDRLASMLRLTCPEPDVVRRVLNKRLTLEAAEQCGVPVPKTHWIPDRATLDIVGPSLRFPLVAKPYSKAKDSSFKVRYLPDAEELKRAFEADSHFGINNLIQEFVAGEGVGIGVLLHNGAPIAMFQHRRLKELPVTGGVSVMAVSEALDPLLSEYALSLLHTIQWEGVAMVEFKYDRTERRAVLMEVNGRYWGSISLAVQAGVDFPYYHWQIMHGQPPWAHSSYRTGLRWRWATGDLLRVRELVHDKNLRHRYHRSVLSEMSAFLLDFRPGIGCAIWSLGTRFPVWWSVCVPQNPS